MRRKNQDAFNMQKEVNKLLNIKETKKNKEDIDYEELARIAVPYDYSKNQYDVWIDMGLFYLKTDKKFDHCSLIFRRVINNKKNYLF